MKKILDPGKTKPITLFFTIMIVLSCQQNKEVNPELWKQEIRDTELAFAQMAKEKGIKEAFLTYMADDAVLMRNNAILKTSEEISKSLDGAPPTGLLEWEPEFIDVSSSGDLGYTYGPYTYTLKDSMGDVINRGTGVFHTVWKRQKDGSWKFVWD